MIITHQFSPSHDADHVDAIYRSVEDLLESIEEDHSLVAVALHKQYQCGDCFRQAVLHVIELLPHCSTVADASSLAQEYHMECVLAGRFDYDADSNTVAGGN